MSEQKEQFRLPKPFAENWLTALRSGEYIQTQSTLVLIRETPEYCCLGVAGVICGLSNDELGGWGSLGELMTETCQEDFDSDEYVAYVNHEREKLLSLGLPDELLHDSKGSLSGELIKLNDVSGYTFPQIADWVEENVELY